MKPRRTLSTLFLLVLAQPLSLFSDEPEIEYARAYPILGYRQAQAKELKSFADRVEQLTGAKLRIVGKQNPVCCVWLEFTGTPNPGQPGYVIVHQPGGTVIQASDAEQMKLAVSRWETASRKASDGTLEFPVGLMTSYKVIK